MMMNSGRRWKLVVALALVLLSVLVGCSGAGDASTTESPGPTSAKELYERYRENNSADNFHMTMRCVLNMEALGRRVESTVTEEADMAGDAGHATVSAEVVDQVTEAELYVAKEDESYVVYMRAPDTDAWTKQSHASASPTDSTAMLGDESRYENAAFEEIDDGYRVTLVGGDADSLTSQLGSLESLGPDVQKAFEEALRNTQVTVEFGKDCLPRSMALKMDISLDNTSVASFISSMSYDIHMEMSDYGSVDPASVAVPQSVKEAAVEQTVADGLGALTGTASTDSSGDESESKGQSTEESRTRALERAKQQLDPSDAWSSRYFSRDGLIEWLEYSFSHEDAVYAADNCGANWNEQAVGQAKKNLERSAYGTHSRKGMIESLQNDGFTKEQATYGADNCGADWNEQAVNEAKEMLESRSRSYDGMVQALEQKGFTKEQAIYAADNCGADWNEQAVAKAKSMLESGGKSYDGMVQILQHDGFTKEQATHAADNCGADWNEQAVAEAKSLLDNKTKGYSHDGMLKALQKEGFTAEQAAFAADSCGADWNEQAVKKAAEYVEYYGDRTKLTKDDLVALLESDGFTKDQATVGADSVNL